jgi:hypothetical protein
MSRPVKPACSSALRASFQTMGRSNPKPVPPPLVGGVEQTGAAGRQLRVHRLVRGVRGDRGVRHAVPPHRETRRRALPENERRGGRDGVPRPGDVLDPDVCAGGLPERDEDLAFEAEPADRGIERNAPERHARRLELGEEAALVAADPVEFVLRLAGDADARRLAVVVPLRLEFECFAQRGDGGLAAGLEDAITVVAEAGTRRGHEPEAAQIVGRLPRDEALAAALVGVEQTAAEVTRAEDLQGLEAGGEARAAGQRHAAIHPAHRVHRVGDHAEREAVEGHVVAVNLRLRERGARRRRVEDAGDTAGADDEFRTDVGLDLAERRRGPPGAGRPAEGDAGAGAGERVAVPDRRLTDDVPERLRADRETGEEAVAALGLVAAVQAHALDLGGPRFVADG